MGVNLIFTQTDEGIESCFLKTLHATQISISAFGPFLADFSTNNKAVILKFKKHKGGKSHESVPNPE
jgi:hypothetical protein